MLKKLTNNLGFKILSVVLAFIVWLLVMNVEDPKTSKTFYGITVAMNNEEAITSLDKSIEYKEGKQVDVTVRGKRSLIDRLTVAKIKAYADLGKMSITGAVDINVELPSGVNVIEQNPGVVLIALEDVITVQKEVQAYMEGEPKENYTFLDPIVNPNNVEITGPKSKIALISSVLVPINIQNASRDIILSGKPNVYDKYNKKIEGLNLSNSLVSVQVPIRKLKTINFIDQIEKNVPEGYKLISVKFDKQSIKVYGKENAINNLENIKISGIDLSNVKEDRSITLKIKNILPTGVYAYNKVENLIVEIDVEPIVTKSIIIKDNNITVKNLASDLTFKFANEDDYELVFKGIQKDLDDITLETLIPSVSVEEKEAGIHKVPLEFTKPLNSELESELPMVKVELTKIEEETTTEIE